MSGALLAAAQSRLDGLERYSAGREAPSEWGKLSSNESPLGPSPAARRAVAQSAQRVHRYGSSEPLRVQLAAVLEVDREQVVLTNGSDELCYLVATLLIERDTPVVLSSPCYRIDEIVTRVQGGSARFVALVDGMHDLDGMAAAADGARIVWLPSPHNPTGRCCEPAALAGFLAAVPEDCLVVLDEAYRPFVDPELRPDVAALLERHPNLLVQRTLSKADGLAGLRIGYGIGDPALVAALQTIRPPFNLNQVALAAAGAALADDAWPAYVVELVRRERALLESCLAELGVEHHASQANFVTARLGAEAERVRTTLAEAGISVRDGADLGLPGHVRISLGLPAAMAVVREVLRTELRSA